MEFVYIGIILFVAVAIACIIVYFKKENDEIEQNAFVVKKLERDDFTGKKILYIGNSCGCDSIKYVSQIAYSLSIKNLIIASLCLNDSSIETHLKNAKSDEKLYEYRKNENGEIKIFNSYSLNDGLLDESWDLIVLQQHPDLAGFWSSYDAFLTLLKSHLFSVRPNALLAFNMIWPYCKNSKNPCLAQFGYDSDKMYERISSVASTRIDNDYDFYCVIPTATAIQNASALSSDNLYRDDIHLSDKGEFLASLCFVKEVFNPALNELAFAPDCVDRKIADTFILATNSAYENPFFVSVKNKNFYF